MFNNLIGSGSGPFTQNSFDTRIDYAASSSINVFGRFSLDYFKLSGKGLLGAVGGPGNGLLGLSGSSITHNYSLASGFTKTISSSLLTDFRFGYFKYNPQTQKPDWWLSDDRLRDSEREHVGSQDGGSGGISARP